MRNKPDGKSPALPGRKELQQGLLNIPHRKDRIFRAQLHNPAGVETPDSDHCKTPFRSKKNNLPFVGKEQICDPSVLHAKNLARTG